MFTGIIEELGSVRSIEERGENARIVIAARIVTEGTNHGDSIAVNGVCLTALDIQPDSFAADVSRETLLRSTLGRLRRGRARQSRTGRHSRDSPRRSHRPGARRCARAIRRR